MAMIFGVFGVLTAVLFFVAGCYYGQRISKARHVHVIGELAMIMVPPEQQHQFFTWCSDTFHSLTVSDALTVSSDSLTTKEQRDQVQRLVKEGLSIDEACQKVFNEKKKT